MEFKYAAIFVRQRDGEEGVPAFALFAAPVGEVSRWARVNRLKTAGGGHQRPKNAAKVAAIQRFLQRETKNTIPTAITVVLRLGLAELPPSMTCSEISIPDVPEDPPGIVIDGQHRLFGIQDFDPMMPVNVVALIDADDDEAAFQFLVINNKATRVAQDHIKLLSLRYAEDVLVDRLRSARMVLSAYTSLLGIVDTDPGSPFFHAVTWPVEQEQEGRLNLVLPAAIEQALSVIAQQRLPDLDDSDALLDFFYTLWRVVKDSWPVLWVPGSRLLSKVGVVTLTTFVTEDLAPLADRGRVNLADPANVDSEIREIVRDLDPAFWLAEWTSKSLDTSAGREFVVDAIKQMRRNNVRGLRWSDGITLIAPETQEESLEPPKA